PRAPPRPRAPAGPAATRAARGAARSIESARARARARSHPEVFSARDPEINRDPVSRARDRYRRPPVGVAYCGGPAFGGRLAALGMTGEIADTPAGFSASL